MTFKPRHELPVNSPDDPGNPWPNVLQLPIQTRKTIDASQNWFDVAQDPVTVADGIVDFYASTIANFVGVQRRDYAAGIVQVHSKFFNLPGLTLQYENRSGAERLSMTAYPESFTGGVAQNVEFNYDGYFSLTSLGQGQNVPVAYDFFVNGVQFGTYTMAENALGTVAFRFGATALRCQSLCDESEGGPGNPNASTLGLVQPIVPPRAKIKAFTNNIGNPIVEHDDLPGYMIYFWESKLNNSGNAGVENPPVLATIDLGNVDQISGFKKTGFNQFRVRPQSNFYPADTANLAVMAEFYCRDPATYRTVGQSWTRAGGVTVNDKPNYWKSVCTIIPDIGLDVDLTATQNILTTTPVAFGIEDWTFNSTIGGDVGQPSNPPYDRGYWRLGDGPSAQAAPPAYPWNYAMEAATDVVTAWQNILALLSLYENNVGPNIPYFTYIDDQITTAQNYRTAVDGTAAEKNVYDLNSGAPASIESSQGMIQTALNYALGGAGPGPADPPTGLAYAPPYYTNNATPPGGASAWYNMWFPNTFNPLGDQFGELASNCYAPQVDAMALLTECDDLITSMAAYTPP